MDLLGGPLSLCGAAGEEAQLHSLQAHLGEAAFQRAACHQQQAFISKQLRGKGPSIGIALLLAGVWSCRSSALSLPQQCV